MRINNRTYQNTMLLATSCTHSSYTVKGMPYNTELLTDYTKRIKWTLPLIMIFILVFLNEKSGHAQQEKNKATYQRFQASYILGAQLYNDNFLYNPGYALSASYGKSINKDISLGLGMSYMKLTNETFLPVYLEVIGKKRNKKNAPYISIQGGYSPGWTRAASPDNNYNMKGGAFINAGLGRMIRVNEDYSMLFQWSYCHQFAKLEYEIFGGRPYSEVINYDMIQISIGLLFN